MKLSASTGVLVSVLLACAGPASAQEFVAYEGKNSVQEGDGGTKKIIDGVDMWADGAPPRKFKLIGYITDRRFKSGLIGKLSMSNLESDIATAAKKQGADAVILVSEGAETLGHVGSGVGGSTGQIGSGGAVRGSTWGTQTSVAVQKNVAKYAVIKYLEVAQTAAVSADAPPGTLVPTEEPKMEK